MSTILIDTDGGSKFSEGTQVGADVGRKILETFGVNTPITLTDTDAKPILKPRKNVIDVVSDFSWYSGPKATEVAINKIPCVFLQEREQLVSSLATGAMYYLNAAARGVNNILQGGDFGNILSLLGGINNNEALGSRISLANNEDTQLLAQHNLKSLEGIYFTKKTGFNYRLPMYGSPSEKTNEWGYEGGGIARKVVDARMAIGQNIAEIVNLGQPGVFIEKPRYFTNATQGRTETITFPLANTIKRGTHSPIQQNYELLWLLTFNNKPYKTSFGTTPPPKIYSVSVPGQWSMPYAYISSLNVEFEGTIRNTKVTVPMGNGEPGTAIGSKLIETPTPEAYKVTIAFTSLLGDYGNTMLSDAYNVSIDGTKVKFGGNNKGIRV